MFYDDIEKKYSNKIVTDDELEEIDETLYTEIEHIKNDLYICFDIDLNTKRINKNKFFEFYYKNKKTC